MTLVVILAIVLLLLFVAGRQDVSVDQRQQKKQDTEEKNE